MNMKKSLTSATVLLLTVLGLVGCGGEAGPRQEAAPAPTLESPDAISACLPTGVTLETKVSEKDADVETVKDVLARFKATARNKKLYDLNGREIRFHKSSAKGMALKNDKEYAKLTKRYTVLVYDGS